MEGFEMIVCNGFLSARHTIPASLWHQLSSTKLKFVATDDLQFLFVQMGNPMSHLIEFFLEILKGDPESIALVLQGHFQYLDVSVKHFQKAVRLVGNVVVRSTGAAGPVRRDRFSKGRFHGFQSVQLEGHPLQGRLGRLFKDPPEGLCARLEVLVDLGNQRALSVRSQRPPAGVKLEKAVVVEHHGRVVRVLHLTKVAIVVHALVVGVLKLLSRLDVAEGVGGNVLFRVVDARRLDVERFSVAVVAHVQDGNHLVGPAPRDEKQVGVLRALPVLLVVELHVGPFGPEVLPALLKDARFGKIPRRQAALFRVAEDLSQKLLSLAGPRAGQQSRGRSARRVVKEIGQVGRKKGAVTLFVLVEHPGDRHALVVRLEGIDHVAPGDHHEFLPLGDVHLGVHGVRAGASQTLPLDLGMKEAVLSGADPVDEALLVGLGLLQDGLGSRQRRNRRSRRNRCHGNERTGKDHWDSV